ncbi:ATP-binding protein [Runella aurantiaca]|uniref:ATP-binding protein n=1 Tax=Runella aurantiaca TaxID=2282308 RepID=A0A369I8I2_9BACT|nr:ATP-binding protein [Runella aurantiaca]
MIERQIKEQVVKNLTYFPVVGIVGPRQVGKTTLSKIIQKNLNIPSLHLDLELDDDLYKLQNPQTYLQMHAEKCIIIDEIQRLPSLFPLLRALIDQDRRPARFIILGSASPEMIRHSSESLAGRIAYSELTPFSLLELQSTTIQQSTHWFLGGFPSALLAPSPDFSRIWLQNFIYTFIEKDIRLLGYDISIPTMDRLLKMLAHLHSAILNVSDISRSLGVSIPTVNKYLDLLEGGFLIRRLQPYFVNLGKRLVKTPKMYIRDTGILHSLASIPSYEALYANPLIGASWEGYVIEQIYRCVEPRSWNLYYYRTQVGAEVDLVLISPSGKMTCIEIKNTNTPKLSKGFHQCINDLQPHFQYVITPSSELLITAEGVIICSLLQFLKIELPKIT